MSETVLITGASSGIGLETARLFARHGHPVIINYNLSEQPALELANEINSGGGKALAIKADVSRPNEVESLFSKAESGFGGVDILINNAGLAWSGLIQQMKDGEWERLRQVDLDGVFYCCRRAVPGMVRNHRGSIINISSVWGVCGASMEAAYSALKAGVIGLTKALAKELGPSGIRVNAIAPGVIQTKMNGHLDEAQLAALIDQTPLGRMGLPGDVAECAFFLASNSASFITGQVLSVDGGFAL